MLGAGCGERIILNVKALHHELEQRQALAVAGRVVVAVVANLALWRLSHPELCHAHGRVAMQEGILQQLGGAALAGAAWWQSMEAMLEDSCDIAALAARVAHHKELEQLTLQRLAHGASLGFQSVDCCLQVIEPLCYSLYFQAVALLEPAQLGFHELALLDERGLLLGSDFAITAPLVAL